MSDEHSYSFETHSPPPDEEPQDTAPPDEALSAGAPAIWLRLKRYVGTPSGSDRGPGEPVLLLHGASACHRTFTVPKVGLAQWLFEKHFDPWLLDWRGSHLVVRDPLNRASLQSHPKAYNFNRAAAEDVPAAIRKMRAFGVKGPIALLGHCMGSAVVAEAVAMGHVAADVNRIVLIALGLFYEAPIDSRLKSEERILERLTLMTGRNAVPFIDPRIDEASGRLRIEWPDDLNNLYDAWPGALRSHDEPRDGAIGAMCNRLSFMYGMPYHHTKLAVAIHGNDSVAAELPNQFGAIPLHMYLHAAKNLRRGQATPFEPPAVTNSETPHPPSDADFVSEKSRARFRRLEKVTLITGALNRLWHRDSVDRMHEWLCRGSSLGLRKIRKHVLAAYAHQDLLWGKDSPDQVYSFIEKGLRETSSLPKPS
jgi:pimeloyl-ACP methyl ester carboxylesterase